MLREHTSSLKLRRTSLFWIFVAKHVNNTPMKFSNMQKCGASRNFPKPLARHLIGCGNDLVLVSGRAVKNNRLLLDGRWDKHDTKCAANIADLVSRGKCLYYDMPSEQITELRSFLSLRRRLKKEAQRNA